MKRAAPASPRCGGFWIALFTSAALTSCNSTERSTPGLNIDPAALADAALAELDADGSGDLSAEETSASPGLEKARTMGDRNADGRLSRDELVERFTSHVSTGPVPYGFEVTYRGRPLAGATVDLIPAAFYGDALPKAQGTTSESGFCEPVSMGVERGVWMGIYRVEVQAPDAKLPAKYNAQSELGLEVVEGGHLTREGRPPVLELK